MTDKTYFIITFAFTFVFVTGLFLLPLQPETIKSKQECISWHTEKSPHHTMCLNGNNHPFCQNSSEWETYQVCDKYEETN